MKKKKDDFSVFEKAAKLVRLLKNRKKNGIYMPVERPGEPGERDKKKRSQEQKKNRS